MTKQLPVTLFSGLMYQAHQDLGIPVGYPAAMLDKTVNNALLQLRAQIIRGGLGGLGVQSRHLMDRV